MLELEVDLVITALGSRPGPVAASGEPSLVTDETGRALVSDDRATNVPGVYAGGDLVRGPATVVEAIGDGLRAAEAIDHRLAVDEQPAGTSVNNRRGGVA
jgi:glutamate synthase (NADPH/NADH) small chain